MSPRITIHHILKRVKLSYSLMYQKACQMKAKETSISSFFQSNYEEHSNSSGIYINPHRCFEQLIEE